MEGVKQATRAGLAAMVEALEAVMSGISDGIKCDREVRQEKNRGMEIKIGLMEEDIRESKAKIEIMRQAKVGVLGRSRRRCLQTSLGRLTGS